MRRRHVGMHWVHGAYREALEDGVTFTWVKANTLGNPAYAGEWRDWTASGLDAVVQIDLNEPMLHNTGDCWRVSMTHVKADLMQRGLRPRLHALQIHDELHSRLAHVPNILDAPSWPGLIHAAPAERVAPANVWLAQRIAELREIWGADLPRGGIGIAETGGLAEVGDCWDWIGCNFYRVPGYWPTPKKIHDLYASAAAGPFRLMPVIGTFVDGAAEPTSLLEMGAAYGPPLAQHADTFRLTDDEEWIAFFCLNHPYTYAPAAHGSGRGILQLDPVYRHEVRKFIRDYKAAA